MHVTFADWVPGLCSLLGILVINLIDKDRIRGEEGFSDSRAVWRARLFLFVGFALMAGGLAGSVVRHSLSPHLRVLRSNDCACRRYWYSSTSFPGIQISISTTGTPTSQRMCASCFPQSCSGSRKAEVASTNTISRFDLMGVQLFCNLTSESLYTSLSRVSNTYCYLPFFYSRALYTIQYVRL